MKILSILEKKTLEKKKINFSRSALFHTKLELVSNILQMILGYTVLKVFRVKTLVVFLLRG